MKKSKLLSKILKKVILNCKPSLIVLMLFFLFSLPIYSEGIPMLYPNNYNHLVSSYEYQLIEHARTSFENSLQLQSKLTEIDFEETELSKEWRGATLPNYHFFKDLTKINYYHLLNNLCAFEGASHLHVGLLTGDSFVAALYGNQHVLDQQVGLDWFNECPEEIFLSNCNQYLNADFYRIIKSDCFNVDKTLFTRPIDIYFYDADHSLKGHEKALTYYHDILAEVFIVVIDDWDCPWIRGATFKAFKKMNYAVLYENFIPLIESNQSQYVAVIRKQRESL